MLSSTNQKKLSEKDGTSWGGGGDGLIDIAILPMELQTLSAPSVLPLNPPLWLLCYSREPNNPIKNGVQS